MKVSVNFPATQSVVCLLLMPQLPYTLFHFSFCAWLQMLACVCMFISHHRSRIIDFDLITVTGVGGMGGGGREDCFPGDISTPAELPGAAVTAPCAPPYGKGTVKALRLWNTAGGKKQKNNTRRSPLSQITFHAQLFRWIIGATNKNGTL